MKTSVKNNTDKYKSGDNSVNFVVVLKKCPVLKSDFMKSAFYQAFIKTTDQQPTSNQCWTDHWSEKYRPPANRPSTRKKIKVMLPYHHRLNKLFLASNKIFVNHYRLFYVSKQKYIVSKKCIFSLYFYQSSYAYWHLIIPIFLLLCATTATTLTRRFRVKVMVYTLGWEMRKIMTLTKKTLFKITFFILGFSQLDNQQGLVRKIRQRAFNFFCSVVGGQFVSRWSLVVRGFDKRPCITYMKQKYIRPPGQPIIIYYCLCFSCFFLRLRWNIDNNNDNKVHLCSSLWSLYVASWWSTWKLLYKKRQKLVWKYYFGSSHMMKAFILQECCLFLFYKVVLLCSPPSLI